MKESDKELGDLLRFDPLSTAEKLTGTSYKDETPEGKATMALGFGLHMQTSQMKDAELRERDDTTFSNEYGRYTRIVASEGFDRILQEPFKGSSGKDELFEIWFHPDGILLHFDTYTFSDQQQPHINGGNFEYAIKFRTKDHWSAISSGSMRSGVWVGYHDAREAFRFHLRQLRAVGDFQNPWPEDPEHHWWLLHHMDHRTPDGVDKKAYARRDRGHEIVFNPETMYDYDAISRARIAKFPRKVRDCIRA